MDRPSQLKVVRRHLSSRRRFLGSAVSGLGAMMGACGRDQGPRDFLQEQRPREGTGGRSIVDEPPGGAGGSPTIVPSDGGSPIFTDGGAGGAGAPAGPFPDFGPLGEPNELGVRLPEGYRVELLATSGQRVRVASSYLWPSYPDGGATFALSDGGHIYVCNSEVSSAAGGVSALVFSADGELVDAYAIATGTSMNCQGGATPWGTFLTCEEVTYGRVLECDPLGVVAPIERPALGLFRHEGLAYDDDEHHLYMTEDVTDGGLYRFVPAQVVDGVADLTSGTLQIAKLTGGALEWLDVPDPQVMGTVETRYQLEESEKFNGGEGIWYQDRVVTFTTKGDDRVWTYNTQSGALSVLYDRTTATNPILSGVDAVVGTAGGELMIAEDLGDMQVVVILPNGELKPVLQIDNQASSEITGLALSPDGSRLYFSSQRGGPRGAGLTYVLSGFLTPEN